MADASTTRRHTARRAELTRWQVLATKLRRWVVRCFDAAGRHWVWLLAVASLIVMVWLTQWGGQLAGGENATDDACARAALAFDGDAAVRSCSAQLRRLVGAAVPGDALTCTPGGGNRDWLCLFHEPGKPRLYVWLDNVLVALYTGFFAGGICLAYARLRPLRRPESRTLRAAFVVSIVSCLAGAVADQAENFWLLARMGKPFDEQAAGLTSVAELSIWKFRLAFANVALLFGWGSWAMWRRRFPQPVVVRWPRRCWDRRSRTWFDAASVRYDISNVARAYPLFPSDLIGLSGAPRDTEIRCEVEGDRIVVWAGSAMLIDPYVVVAQRGEVGRSVRSVQLLCPNLKKDLRDQGLDERIVLAACCTAWRLGATTLESVVTDLPDEAGRTQNRRWVRLALRLGWDAELPDHAREGLPPGLVHIRSLQELMRYPDGRRWWSTANFTLTLRFVCDPEVLQRSEPDFRQFDEERLAVDRLCLTRLQAFAADRGVRIGL